MLFKKFKICDYHCFTRERSSGQKFPKDPSCTSGNYCLLKNQFQTKEIVGGMIINLGVLHVLYRGPPATESFLYKDVLKVQFK